MKTKRSFLILVGLIVVLLVVNASVLRYERLFRHGQVALLELSPVDPRSLMQGDYMRLDFAIAREIASFAQARDSDGGFVVVRADDRGIARLVRTQKHARVDAQGELAIRYRTRNGQIVLGSDAYFFEEGRATHFEQARFGELRVAPDGTALLRSLRDANLGTL